MLWISSIKLPIVFVLTFDFTSRNSITGQVIHKYLQYFVSKSSLRASLFGVLLNLIMMKCQSGFIVLPCFRSEGAEAIP